MSWSDKAASDNSIMTTFSRVDSAHFYFEGAPNLLPGLYSSDKVKSEKNKRFVDLLSLVEKLDHIADPTQLLLQNVDSLIVQIQSDIAWIEHLGVSDALSSYVLDYAYIDRKSHYYAIKLEMLILKTQDGRADEKHLLAYFKIVLCFLEHFYSSGLLNAYRKNEQTNRYGLLEKMLAYLVESPKLSRHEVLVGHIFEVSRNGEVKMNRSVLSQSDAYAEVIRSLLAQIEPIEYNLYNNPSAHLKPADYGLRNKLRDMYVKIVQATLPDLKSASKKVPSGQGTTIAFLSGSKYTFQYIYDDNDRFQLIAHPKRILDRQVGQVIEEMDLALQQFDGSAVTLDKMMKSLNEVSERLIDPIEVPLQAHLQVIPDGMLCFLPFGMLLSKDDSYLLEAFDIEYHFNTQDIESDLKLSEVYNVQGQFKGMLELQGSLRLREAISFEQFKSLASDNSLLHLGTHQIIKDDEPVILLNDQDSISRSDWLHVPHVMGVLFSMCSGLRGEITSGENARSFGSRAYETGSDNIISTLWKVDDYATVELMETYFANLDEGMSSSESLRLAKLSYLEKTDAFHKHPVFWAGFVHYGASYRKNNLPGPGAFLLLLLAPLFVIRLRIRIKF